MFMATAIKNRALPLALLALVSAHAAIAQEQTFTVGGEGMANKQVMAVESDAQFENFASTTNQITGQVKFNPQARTGSAKVQVDLSKVDTGIPLRNEHMRSEGWFNTDKFPTATFETTSIKFLSGDKYRVTGKFTVKGVTKTFSTDATVKFLKESEQTKAVGLKGNGVMIRTNFTFKMSDFGIIVPDRIKQKVADKLSVKLVIFGHTG